MSAIDDISRYESQLDNQKRELRRDVHLLKDKVLAARSQLGPTRLIREQALWLCGATLLLGFLLGRRNVRLEEVGKLAARNVLSTAGKQAVSRFMATAA